MATNIPVFVPFRAEPDSPRWNNWKRVEPHWKGYSVVLGPSPEGPFNISAARNAAAASVKWDIAIFADADSIVPHDQLKAGIAVAKKTRQAVLPHSRWVNVDPHEHDTLFSEGYVPFRPGRTVHGGTKSSIVIIPREAYEAVNGYDERFAGWGWEDTAFHQAVTALYKPFIQFEGNLWHLDHPRPAADVNRGLDEDAIRNRMHFRNYQQVRNDTELRKLVSKNR